jgi:hypothetical protein
VQDVQHLKAEQSKLASDCHISFFMIMTKYPKRYCNLCGYETNQDEDGCVYHQVVKTDSEGVRYLKYEEFDQNGC